MKYFLDYITIITALVSNRLSQLLDVPVLRGGDLGTSMQPPLKFMIISQTSNG
jgi:hypothetical protein